MADSTSISEARLRDFEEGERRPSRKQLERLAEIYGVPTYSLFLDTIPNVPPTPSDFRKSQPQPATISPRGMKRLWASEKIATFARQLSIEVKYENSPLARDASPAALTKARARAVREDFDEWFLSRKARLELSGSNEAKVLTALRLFLEAQGNVVNINDAPAEDFLGFYTQAEGALETVFVNRSIASKKAQLFTLTHEYCHALMKQEGISDPFVIRNAVERTCNQFAAEFLAPMDSFKKLVESQPRSLRDDVFNFVASVSAQSLLSKQATAIRLVEAGYLSKVQFRKWEDVWREAPKLEKSEEATSSGGGAPHAKRISEIGYLPVFLAAEAVERKLIDSVDVQSGLGLSEKLQDSAFSLARKRLNVARG